MSARELGFILSANPRRGRLTPADRAYGFSPSNPVGSAYWKNSLMLGALAEAPGNLVTPSDSRANRNTL